MATYGECEGSAVVPVDFKERIQSLPPELRSEIYKLTFSVTPGRRLIDESTVPPSVLQVNRYQRQRLASSWYGRPSEFEISADLAND